MGTSAKTIHMYTYHHYMIIQSHSLQYNKMAETHEGAQRASFSIHDQHSTPPEYWYSAPQRLSMLSGSPSTAVTRLVCSAQFLGTARGQQPRPSNPNPYNIPIHRGRQTRRPCR